MTVGLVSLGCAKNRVDSEQILELLRQSGFRITSDPAEAEILLVNTCGFIEPAKQESLDTLFEMAQYKQTGRLKVLAAVGCLAQRYGQALHDEMPELDAVIGVGEYPRLPELLKEALEGRRPLACGRSDGVFEGGRMLTTEPFSAFVRISDGCDNRCAYCAIPLIRGGYRSRPYGHVADEIRALAARGVREVTLIAQDTTRFGDDLPGRPRLSDLMREACRVEGIRWVRTLYCYPTRVDEGLLDVLANEEKCCPYLDIPLQHIDAQVLRRMHRQGTPEQIRSLIAKARERGLTLRTTMMVGFPGETEDSFRRLLDFVEETRFDRLGAFAFSAEEDTPAADMPDQVPEEVRQERLDRLMRLQQRISLQAGKARVGGTETALIVRGNGDGWIARTAREAPEGDGVVMLHGEGRHEAGEFVNIRVTGAGIYDLTGEILK